MDDRRSGHGVTRRTVLRGLALGGAAAVAGALDHPPGAAPLVFAAPGPSGAPPPEGLHLTFGSDPTRTLVASWTSLVPVYRPSLRLGTPDGGHGRVVPAATRAYVEPRTGAEVHTHHAAVENLGPDTTYVYEVFQGDPPAVAGTFRTAPCGRVPFRFTSFGDHAANAPGDPFARQAASDLVEHVERAAPLFHLVTEL